MSHPLLILRGMERLITDTPAHAAAGTDGCLDCHAGFEHCHESSIEHADGFTECLDSTCTLDHGLHVWQLSCTVFDPPCACSPEESDLVSLAVAA